MGGWGVCVHYACRGLAFVGVGRPVAAAHGGVFRNAGADGSGHASSLATALARRALAEKVGRTGLAVAHGAGLNGSGRARAVVVDALAVHRRFAGVGEVTTAAGTNRHVHLETLGRAGHAGSFLAAIALWNGAVRLCSTLFEADGAAAGRREVVCEIRGRRVLATVGAGNVRMGAV